MEVSPVFLANYIAFGKKSRIIANQGGTRSGKTYSITQLLITVAIREICSISFVSSTLPHVKRGVLRDFKEIMMSSGLWDDKLFNKSELIYTFKNGSVVEFFSADSSEKLRGPKRDYLFINEANLLTHDEFRQLILRTKKKVFIDYNPVDEFSWIYDRILTRDDCRFIQSTYLDNYDFLPREQIDEIERLRDEDENYWQVFGLGNIAKATNLIYPNYTVGEYSGRDYLDTVYGIDFGFNNPSAIVEVKRDGYSLYVRELLYESHLTNNDLVAKAKTLIANPYDQQYADAAEPDRIEELYRAGFNVMPADKSVKTGIDFVKRFKIFIHPNSVNLLKEIRMYKWKQDKNENILDDPVKFNDHALDALRYAAFTHGMKYWLSESGMVFPTSLKSKRSRLESNYSNF